MGRKSNDEKTIEMIINIIIAIIAFPILCIYAIGKLIIFIINKCQNMQNPKPEYIPEKSPEIEVMELNDKLKENNNKLNELLDDNIPVYFNVNEYYSKKLKEQEYELYVSQKKPNYEDILKQENVIKKNIVLEFIFKKRKIDRLLQEDKAKVILDQKLKEYEESENKRKKEYIEQQDKLLNEINTYNNDIFEQQENYKNRDEDEVTDVFYEYMRECISNTILDTEFYLRYNSKSDILIIDYEFPDISIISEIKEYKYIKKNYEIKEILFSKKEQQKLYENFILKLTLKLIKYAFDFDNNFIKNIVFNGNIYTLDLSTGKHAKFTILSVAISYEQFLNINLKKVDAKACLVSLGMRYINDLSNIKNIVPFDNVELSKNYTTMNNIDYNIDGFEFEKFSKELLIANGFQNIEVTTASGDYGADVIAYKNDIKYAIQCKKFSTPVGVKAIQEVIGSKSIYNCHVAVVLTNSTFTINAQKLASKNNVLLWDREKLKELINKYENQKICK